MTKRTSVALRPMPLELLLSVAQFDLSTRASRCLKMRGVHYVGDLVSLSESDLREGGSCGPKTIGEINAILADLGLSLSMPIPTWRRADIARLAERHAPELSRIRQAWLRRRYSVDSRSSVETEIASALAAVLDAKYVSRLEPWIGLDQSAKPTFEYAADLAHLTRERLRQIAEFARRKLAVVQFEMPRLRSAVDVLSRLPLWSESRARALLVSERLAGPTLSIRGLFRAAELFGVPVPSTMKSARVAAQAKEVAMVKKIGRAGRRAVERWGCSTINEVCAQVNPEGDTTFTADVVRETLMSRPDFRWLDEGSGWFWLKSTPGHGRSNRLQSRIDKVLAVAARVDLVALRASLARDNRMDGFVPSRRVLANFCRQLEDCRLVGGRTVVDTLPRDPAAVLSRRDREMVAIFRAHGPVLSSADALRLGREAGLKKSLITLHLYSSPVVRRVAAGVFTLVGARVRRSEIEAKTNTRNGDGAVYQSARDYGWRADGCGLWVDYRISEALLLSGKSRLPDATLRHLDFRGYELRDRDGSRIGHADVNGDGLYGLLPFFRKHGGNPGDNLRVTFDLAKRVALVELSEEAFDNSGSLELDCLP